MLLDYKSSLTSPFEIALDHRSMRWMVLNLRGKCGIWIRSRASLQGEGSKWWTLGLSAEWR